MKLANRLGKVSDDELLEQLGLLVRRQNALTAVLLAHIAEVDRRALYLREACSSMHRYCVERLGLSDGAAYKRIRAARAARRFPILLEMLERGELHLKGVTLLAPHLTEGNHRELLAQAKGQPVRAIEKFVAEIAPRPAVPSRLRSLPQELSRFARGELTSDGLSRQSAGGAQAADAGGGASSTGTSEQESAAQAFVAANAERDAAVPSPSTPRPKAIAPLAPRMYELRVTIGEDTRADLEQLQDLLGHDASGADPAEILRKALSLLLERTLARKAAVTDKPRKGSDADSGAAKRSRYIPAEVRRTVWLRDDGRCAFRDAAGNRCTSRRKVEFHHVDNWARGADHDAERLELRCRAHNLLQAKLDYGEAFMRAAVRRRSGARERRSPYAAAAASKSPPARELVPGRVVSAAPPQRSLRKPPSGVATGRQRKTTATTTRYAAFPFAAPAANLNRPSSGMMLPTMTARFRIHAAIDVSQHQGQVFEIDLGSRDCCVTIRVQRAAVHATLGLTRSI